MSEQVNEFCVCGKEDGSCNCEYKPLIPINAIEEAILLLLNEEQTLELMSKFCGYCGKHKRENCGCSC